MPLSGVCVAKSFGGSALFPLHRVPTRIQTSLYLRVHTCVCRCTVEFQSLGLTRLRAPAAAPASVLVTCCKDTRAPSHGYVRASLDHRPCTYMLEPRIYPGLLVECAARRPNPKSNAHNSANPETPRAARLPSSDASHATRVPLFLGLVWRILVHIRKFFRFTWARVDNYCSCKIYGSISRCSVSL